jgi:hypothetical protein
MLHLPKEELSQSAALFYLRAFNHGRRRNFDWLINRRIQTTLLHLLLH